MLKIDKITTVLNLKKFFKFNSIKKKKKNDSRIDCDAGLEISKFFQICIRFSRFPFHNF